MSATWTIDFRITSLAGDPSDVTTLLRIPPNQTWKSGERRQEKTSLIHHKTGGELRSAWPPSPSLEAHLRPLVDRLSPAAAALAALDNPWPRQFCCALSVNDDERPEVNI